MTPRRLAFRVEYDGTAFHGWQRQPGTRTVQGTLEATVLEVLGIHTSVDGASRTDAGVHARDQLAAAVLDHPIQPASFVKAISRRLPEDVALRDAREVAADFQPRFSSGGKRYVYRILVGLDRHPLRDRFAWRIPRPIDLAPMRVAAAHLVGTHDFTSFAACDGSHTTAVRTIHRIEVSATAEGLDLEFVGSAFLKQMVRNLVGTLVEVGQGRRAPDSLADVLAARDRRRAGATAPAVGLTLERVWERGDADAPSERELNAQAQVEVEAR